MSLVTAFLLLSGETMQFIEELGTLTDGHDMDVQGVNA